MSNPPTLEESLNEAEWSWIQPHVLRDAVIIVGSQLEILEVGTQIANNNLGQVQKWVEEGFLTKPSAGQIKAWDQNPTQRFMTLIVQPFVLIQSIELIH